MALIIKRTPAVNAALERRSREQPESSAREEDALIAAGIEARDAAALKWLLSETTRASRSRSDLSAAARSEVAAAAAELISTGAKPRILGWSGKGALAGWVQVVTLRLASAMRAKETGDETAELAESLEAVTEAPELRALAKKYQPVLTKALAGALERLDDRQRSLLRMHHLDGISLDGLAKAHQVHRATVARWLADARSTVLDAVRGALVDGQGVGRGEVDSLMRVVHGGLEVSLRRLLG